MQKKGNKNDRRESKREVNMKEESFWEDGLQGRKQSRKRRAGGIDVL